MALSIDPMPVVRLEVDLGPILAIGPTQYGVRRVVPIVGGSFAGSRLKGRVLPGGADWNITRPDGIVEIWARYTLETDDGVLIDIVNQGMGRVSADKIEKLLAGEQMDVDSWYCRTTPKFEVSGEKYRWLNQTVFVGDLLPPTKPNTVFVEVYEVL